jgi:hypothetical protein
LKIQITNENAGFGWKKKQVTWKGDKKEERKKIENKLIDGGQRENDPFLLSPIIPALN